MRLLSRVGGALGGTAIRHGHHLLLALGATWRVRHVGNEHVESARQGGSAILFCCTHGVLLPLAYTHRGRGIHVLISESRDGEVIARIVARLGFGTVRGSSSRGGARAIGELVAHAKRGTDVAITPDGPRGPRGSAEAGAILVAARAKVAIVPVGVAARGAWRARSWDRFLVPTPFAQVWVVYGPPVASGSDDFTDVEAARTRLERGMAGAEERAEACAAGREIPPRAAKGPA